jgi:hypothetical protein
LLAGSINILWSFHFSYTSCIYERMSYTHRSSCKHETHQNSESHQLKAATFNLLFHHDLR